MNAANLAASTVRPAFYLFKTPQIVAPSYDFWRRVGNGLAKYMYAHFNEPTFTNEGFQRGVQMGITSCATAIRLEDQHRLKYLLSKDAERNLLRRLGELPKDVINDRLTFDEDNVVSQFVYSYIISSNRFMGFREEHQLTFYATVVGFIDKNSTQPINMIQVQKRLDELLVCNVTFARIISPLGKWRMSDINFFDGKAINR